MINYSIYITSKKPGTKKENYNQVGTAAYGTAQIHDSLSFDEFCEHIADHNSPFSKGTIKGVLTDAVACIREQLLAGNSVQMGDLGSFYVELSCSPADATDEFTAANIKAVNVTWSPGKNFKNLRDVAEFQVVPSRKAQADAIEVIRNEETIEGLE